jgi:micrococcal nuclease
MVSLVRVLTNGLLRLILLVAVLLAGWAMISHYFIGEDSPFVRAMTGALPVTVERAVDGDTVVARINGRLRRVRVLGIDSPESVKPNSAVQPCGRAASRRAKAWVAKHRSVRLERDPAAPDEDRYGRLLRYVEPIDGTRDLSTVQVTAGLARVKAYGEDLERLPELRRAQSRARSADRGLWGGDCSG